MSCSCPRVMSPTPGRSTLITSAPSQARSCVQVGPDCTWVKSRMRTPSSALPASPKGFVLGRGRPLPFCLTTGFFATLATLSFATGFAERFGAAFFAAGAARPLAAFTFFAIRYLPDSSLFDFASRGASGLFLAQHALRVEVADAAALAARRRVDHRVD